MGLDDVVDGIAGGAAWGLGVATVAGVVFLLGKGGRPVAKRAMMGYLLVSERARELGAEAAEQFQDIYAEAQAEVADQVEATATPGAAQSRRRKRASRA